ncbi:sensor histidine kinase, partial [Streptomyces sp. NRRL WC-3549]|uniref:sensor histidine kinase n=1 Tax=Streptomyces sp. NRRL WC-3549 TaxID=1463925 RepID=UPI001F2EC685
MQTARAISLSTTITASTVFAVSHLALLSARLHSGKEHTAHLVEQRERARMRQDLHDLAGSTLVAIALRGEAALRAPAGPADAPAREALAEITALARRLHGEIRALGQDDELSLADEVVHARRLLAGSGIAVHTVLDATPGPAATACLRFVLREAVGNVLRHSRATRCAIELRSDPLGVRLLVRNNGCLLYTSL